MRTRLIEKRAEESSKKTAPVVKIAPKAVESKKMSTLKEVSATVAKNAKIEKAELPSRSPDQLIKEKFRLVQSRAHHYEVQMNALKEVFPDKEVVSNAIIFLKKSKPSPEQYTALAEAIVKDKTNSAKKIHGLNKTQKQVIIENITWKYLDSVCFNGKDLDKILALKATFKLLKEKGVDMKALYQGWESEKLVEFEPEIDYKKIKKWLLGQ
jgi:hypothetical protein